MNRRLAFAVPGDLATPTGGYAYDRRMIDELRQLGWAIDVLDVGREFPRPSPDAYAAARRTLLAVERDVSIIIDGLAFGVMPDIGAELQKAHPVIALVHHPLALESGLCVAESDAFRASERAALATAALTIVTSATTARLVASDYRVPESRIVIARPGVDPAPRGAASQDGPVRLLAVGSLVPRKGHDVLIAALAPLSELPWRLTIAGAFDRDPDAAQRLRADIARFGLAERVALIGAVSPERLAEFYQTADAFVLASRFEGYGMAYAEAIAQGLPVIGTNAGAIPEATAGAGILVAPDDVAALSEALRALLEEPQTRKRLAAASRAAATRLPTWRASAEIISRALESLR